MCVIIYEKYSGLHKTQFIFLLSNSPKVGKRIKLGR